MLRELRKSKGLSQQKVAELFGVHQTVVSTMERTNRPLSQEQLSALQNLVPVVQKKHKTSALSRAYQRGYAAGRRSVQKALIGNFSDAIYEAQPTHPTFLQKCMTFIRNGLQI